MRFNEEINVYEDIYEILKKLICKSSIKIQKQNKEKKNCWGDKRSEG